MAVEAGLALVAGGHRRQDFALAGARLGSAHAPRVGKVPDLVVAVVPPILAREIIPCTAIEVAAKAAQSLLELGRHRDLQEATAVPFQGQAHLRPQHHGSAIRQPLDGHIPATSRAHVGQ